MDGITEMSKGRIEDVRELTDEEKRVAAYCVDVGRQPHYTQFKIQPLEFAMVNNLPFCEGNIVKYICRYKLKNGIEDLKKARFYLDKLIEMEETGSVTL